MQVKTCVHGGVYGEWILSFLEKTSYILSVAGCMDLSHGRVRVCIGSSKCQPLLTVYMWLATSLPIGIFPGLHN